MSQGGSSQCKWCGDVSPIGSVWLQSSKFSPSSLHSPSLASSLCFLPASSSRWSITLAGSREALIGCWCWAPSPSPSSPPSSSPLSSPLSSPSSHHHRRHHQVTGSLTVMVTWQHLGSVTFLLFSLISLLTKLAISLLTTVRIHTGSKKSDTLCKNMPCFLVLVVL